MQLQKMSKSTLSLWAVIFVAGSVATLAMAAGAYKLVYRMQKGQRLIYKMTMSNETSAEMMGQEMQSSSEGENFMHCEVEEVGKDGKITMVYAIDSLRTHVKSQNPPIDSTFRNPEGLIGKRTRQVINAHGKKLHSAVVDSVKLSGMFAQMGGGQQSALRLVELPEKEVKIGDTWNVSTPDTLQQGGNKFVVTPNLTYTVAGEVDTLGYKCVRLNYKGTTAIKGEGKNMGMNLFIEGEGPNQGTAYFASKEGLLVAMLGSSDLEMTIALTGQMSMTIPQSISTKLALTLVK